MGTWRKYTPVHTRMMVEYVTAGEGPGAPTLATLAAKYGVPVKTVEKWAGAGAWSAGRREFRSRRRAVAANG